MSDSIVGKDRFSTPDLTAKIRGSSEEGVVGSFDNVFHSEEFDSGNSKPYFKGDRISGGGEGGIDGFFDHPESSDPEMMILYKEFIREKRLPMYLDDDGKTLLSLIPGNMSESGAKEAFGLWLSQDDDKKPAKQISKSKEKQVGQVSKLSEGLKPEDKVDTKGFNLVLYQPALDRLTEGAVGEVAKKEAERNRGAVKDFWGVWTHGPNEIKAIGFGVDERKTKVTTVIMRLKDGTSITLPAHVFRKVFDVRHRERNTGVSGLEFVGGNGLKGYIDPFTPPYKLKEIMSKVNINGVKLNPDVRVWIGPYERIKKAPVAQERKIEV